MNETKYFMHRIKRTNGTFDKGIEVKDSLEAAKQSYHAYLGAWGYDHDALTDFVSCMITDENGATLAGEHWARPVVEEPEPEPEPEEPEA